MQDSPTFVFCTLLWRAHLFSFDTTGIRIHVRDKFPLQYDVNELKGCIYAEFLIVVIHTSYTPCVKGVEPSEHRNLNSISFVPSAASVYRVPRSVSEGFGSMDLLIYASTHRSIIMSRGAGFVASSYARRGSIRLYMAALVMNSHVESRHDMLECYLPLQRMLQNIPKACCRGMRLQAMASSIIAC